MRRLRRLPWKRLLVVGPLSLLLLLLVLFGIGYALTDVPAASAVSQKQSTIIRYAGGEEWVKGIRLVQDEVTGALGRVGIQAYAPVGLPPYYDVVKEDLKMVQIVNSDAAQATSPQPVDRRS